MLNEFKKGLKIQSNNSSKKAEDIGVYENFDKIIQYEVKNNKTVVEKNGIKNINPEFNENR